MEPPFDKLKGVRSTTSGYIGGQKKKPTYEEVSRGLTGHAEAVRITYDPEKVTYSKLLEVFWHNIDPTTPNRQFCDAGSQYRAAIFYHDETQRRLAEESKQALEESRRFPKVVVEIAPAGEFYPAEDYHQDYYARNPQEYHEYRYRCGRDQRGRQSKRHPCQETRGGRNSTSCGDIERPNVPYQYLTSLSPGSDLTP
jgi:peptide-methionine (S)-S-oxide reductase